MAGKLHNDELERLKASAKRATSRSQLRVSVNPRAILYLFRLYEELAAEHVKCTKAAQRPKPQSTWPLACPMCGGEWKTTSRTMGAAYGQPHHGICVNGHHWHEGDNRPVIEL